MRFCKDCGAPIEKHEPLRSHDRQWNKDYLARTGRLPRNTARECPVSVVRWDVDRLGRRVPVFRWDRGITG